MQINIFSQIFHVYSEVANSSLSLFLGHFNVFQVLLFIMFKLKLKKTLKYIELRALCFDHVDNKKNI